MVNAQLLITMTATGELKVEGPVQQTGLCYMMLELAKDAIRTEAQKASPIIQVPPGARLALVNGTPE